MRRLAGRTALVTGGATGLGEAVARRLASEGARVVITDIQNELGHAAASRSGFLFLQQNVCDEEQWSEVIEEMLRYCGRLDILVNNAGITGPMDATSPENTRLTDWRRVFAVNVEGVFLGCRAGIKALQRSGGGSIVNLSSVAGLLATPDGTAYGASKAAVRQLTKSVAQYCAQERLAIRCNSVHPGNVRTPLLEECFREIAARRGVSVDEVFKEEESRVPLGDLTRPDDVAAAVAFLASDDARHITGAELIVDGGLIHCDTYRVADTSR
jgi:3(or 17)beta-hydroxysteroid dehydrogenase